jgi:subtilisin-like proprotein convertase family protein
MKTRILLGMTAVMLAAADAHGALIENFNNVNTAIPEGNPVGVAFSGSVSDAGGIAVGVLTVTLNVSGGYNGYLYSYLVAPNGTMTVLLNQPGVTGSNPFGYSGSGLNVTLSDTGGSSIQTTTEPAGVPFTGTYQAAGSLANLYGSPADGTWTLFFADLSSGAGPAELNSWSLGITAVPDGGSTVPDGGSTLAFLALASTGLAWFHRRRAASRARVSPHYWHF